MLSNSQIVSLVNEIEGKINPANFFLGVYNFNSWPIVRIHLAFSVIKSRYKSTEMTVKSQRSSIFKIFTRPNFKNHQPLSLVITSSQYKTDYMGKKYDRVMCEFTDENPDFKEVYFESSINDSYDSNSILVSNYVEVIVKFLSLLLFLGPLTRPNLIFNASRKFYSKANYGRYRHVLESVKIAYKINFVYFMSRYFNWFFAKANVNKVATSNYYNLLSMSIMLWANRLKIDTMSFQHGNQSIVHPAFSDWVGIPRSGYITMPKTFNCWSSSECASIDKWAKRTNFHHSYNYGNPWLRYWKSKELIDRPEYFDRYRFNILVTLQPSVGLLPDILLEAFKKSNPDWNWCFRLHPRQLCNANISMIYKELSKYQTNFVIEESSVEPLPILINFSSIHVTGFSSSAIEAKELGITTIFFHELSKEYFPSLFDLHDAVFASSDDELVYYLDREFKKNKL